MAVIHGTGISRRWSVIALSGLILFHIVSHVAWLALDDRQVNWDPGVHLNHSLSAWEVITSPTTDVLARLTHSTHYVEPPLIYVATAASYALFGFSADTATYINIFFLCLLILATYAIGKDLCGRPTGLVAACLVSCYPLVAAYVRIYYLDLGLATVVTISVYALMRTQEFSNRRASLIFGLALAGGLLTKKAYVIFMFSPVFLIVVKSLFYPSEKTAEPPGSKPRSFWHWLLHARSRLMNLTLALAPGALLPVGWYIDRWQNITRQAGNINAGRLPLWWYVTWLDDVLCSFAALLLIIGIVMTLWRRNPRLMIPLSWFAGGLALHTWIQRGHPRYLLPLLPSIAILSAWWLFRVRPMHLRRLAIATAVLLSLVNYMAFSWYGFGGSGPMEEDPGEKFRRPFPLQPLANSPFWDGPKALRHAYPPRRIGWPYEAILEVVQEDAAQDLENSPLVLVLGADLSGFNWTFGQYYAHLRAVRHPDLRRIVVPDHSRYWRTEDMLDLLDQPYILTKSGQYSGLGPSQAHYIEGFAKIFATIRETLPERFRIIHKFDLPDGTKASLYRRAEPAFREVVDSFRGSKEPLANLERRLDMYAKVARLSPARNPMVTRAYQQLGDVYRQTDDVWTAARIYSAGLEFNPEDRKLYRGLRGACQQMTAVGRGDIHNRGAKSGVNIDVIVSDAQGAERTIYSRRIDPKNRIEDREWMSEVLALWPFTGDVVSVTLRTSSGPAGRSLCDWVGRHESR